MINHFDSDIVEIQLEKILASPEFSRGKRLEQLLRYITKKAINDDLHQVKQYTIAVEAFGCSIDFDPQSNPMVRIVAKRLRRALHSYYSSAGIKDPLLIEIPKGAYTPLFKENSQTPVSNAAVSINSTPKLSPHPECRANSSPSIAVIKFSCLDSSNEAEFISSGLTEEIIISLARFPEFRVVGPLYREILDKQDIGNREITQKYKVRFLLEGTIRVRDEKLRLTVKLKDTFNNVHAWGDIIDCNMQDGSLIECETHIVNSISSVIADNFGVINSILFDDVVKNNRHTNESYKGILLFHHYIQMLDQHSYINALTQLEANAANKQNDPLSLAMLGDILVTSYFLGYENPLILDRIESLVRKAVALDSRCQHAQFLMAMVYFARLQRDKFLETAEKAHRLNQNNAGLSAALAMHTWMAGERNKGMELMVSAIDLNPHHPGWYNILPLLYSYKNSDYETALSKALDFNSPDIYLDSLFRTAIYSKLNSTEKAALALTELLTIFPDFYQNGQEIMKRLFILDEDVEMFWEELMRVRISNSHLKN